MSVPPVVSEEKDRSGTTATLQSKLRRSHLAVAALNAVPEQIHGIGPIMDQGLAVADLGQAPRERARLDVTRQLAQFAQALVVHGDVEQRIVVRSRSVW